MEHIHFQVKISLSTTMRHNTMFQRQCDGTAAMRCVEHDLNIGEIMGKCVAMGSAHNHSTNRTGIQVFNSMQHLKKNCHFIQAMKLFVAICFTSIFIATNRRFVIDTRRNYNIR